MSCLILRVLSFNLLLCVLRFINKLAEYVADRLILFFVFL